MLITLEGVDGAGKSGLAFDIAAELKRRYPNDKVHYLHAGPLKTNPYDAYVEPLKDYRPGTGVHYVLDRWHVGELVYGPLYRGKSAINTATWVWLEMWFAARGMATFHVTQQLDVIRERLASRGEDFLQPEHVEQVWGDFTRQTLEALTYAGTFFPEGANDSLVNEAISVAEQSEELSLGLPTSYVGHPEANVILVGDRRGGPGPYPYDGAFRPVAGNSGDYLLSGLYKYNHPISGNEDLYLWWEVALVNSAPDEESGLDRVAGRPYVAALGREAQKHVVGRGAAPHPQYARRFFNARKSEYIDAVLQAAFTGEDLSKWPNL